MSDVTSISRFVTFPQRKVVPPDWLSRPRRWLENHRVRQRIWRCALLDPRFAKDIGLSELDIASECNTPFWVPVRRNRSLRRSISDRAEPE
jgi:uncharacterized protein YjiS (DUF1127 family)